LTLTFEEFGGFEKLSILDKELSADGASPGDDPEVGDFGYYAPWKDVNMYYKDWNYSSGLYRTFVYNCNVIKIQRLQQKHRLFYNDSCKRTSEGTVTAI